MRCLPVLKQTVSLRSSPKGAYLEIINRPQPNSLRYLKHAR